MHCLQKIWNIFILLVLGRLLKCDMKQSNKSKICIHLNVRYLYGKRQHKQGYKTEKNIYYISAKDLHLDYMNNYKHKSIGKSSRNLIL